MARKIFPIFIMLLLWAPNAFAPDWDGPSTDPPKRKDTTGRRVPGRPKPGKGPTGTYFYKGESPYRHVSDDQEGLYHGYSGPVGVELSEKPDGRYRGRAPDYEYSSIMVDVTIKNGFMTRVEVVEARNEQYVEMAKEVIEKVVEEQTLEVDAVTGATITSKAILGAIKTAVSGEPVGPAEEQR